MKIAESDADFLARHDFDAYAPGYSREKPWEAARDETLNKMENYLIHISGRSFTIGEMQEATGVSPPVLQLFLADNPWAVPTLKRKDGMVTRYQSVAPDEFVTVEGAQEVFEIDRRYRDSLGREAREDYYLMTERGLGGRKKKVINHW